MQYLKPSMKSTVLFLSLVFTFADNHVMAGPQYFTETFSTSGSVSGTRVLGSQLVSFRGVDNGALTTGAPFTFGEFFINPVPNGTTTTYDHTPFSILFTLKSFDGHAPVPNETPVTLSGTLTGSILGNGVINLHADFTSIPNPADPHYFYGLYAKNFKTDSYTNVFDVPNPSFILSAPSFGGETPVVGLVNLLSVPEPSSQLLILFGASTCGLYYRFILL